MKKAQQLHYKICVAIFTGLFISACTFDVIRDVPHCLKQKIRAFGQGEESCGDGNVSEYLFQGATVYVFNSRCCCDFTSEVINEDCITIGTLGGFQGNTVINGEDFSSATFVNIIWTE